MSVPALLRGVRIPGDALRLHGARPTFRIHHLHPIGIDSGDLPILHADNLLGIGKQSWNIRGNIDGSIALTQHQGAVLSGADQIGRAGGQHSQGIRALYMLQGFDCRLQKIGFIIKMNEMGQNLAVCLGGELIAHLAEMLSQL